MSLGEFSEWEHFLEFEDDKSFQTDLHRKQFEEYLVHQKAIDDAKNNPFEFLFTDIINPEKFVYNFKAAFQNNTSTYDIYTCVSDDAQCCIAINPQMRKVDHLVFPNWLDNTLKVADHLVVFYIQTYKNEACVRQVGHGDETSRYFQLQTYSCDHIKTVGLELKRIYSGRNEHAHRMIKKAGKQRLIVPDRKKIQYENVKRFETAFFRLQLAFSNAYPAYVIS